jgi:hypothetical protein
MFRRFETAVMVLAICLLFCPNLRAQTATVKLVGEVGMQRAVFEVPEGKIYANFPDDMALGDRITGTVYPEPSGKNQSERDRNAAAMASYTVELDGLPPTAARHLVWTVPPQARSGHSNIRLHDRNGKTVAQSDLPIIPIGTASPKNSTPEINLPLGGQAGTGVSVWGSFEAGVEPSVTVGGVTALVLAWSPRKMVFLSPREVLGSSTLQVKAGDLVASGPYRALAVRTVATAKDLKTGQPAKMTSTVSGLQDLREPAMLVIVNHSPSTIELDGGPAQRIVIAPGDVRPDGTYQLTRTFRGEMVGGFEIDVVVTLPPSSQLPLQRLAERFVDRWSQVSKIGVSVEARSLIAAGVVAARRQLDDFLLSQAGFQTDPSSALGALVSNYCYDLRDRKISSVRPRGRLEPSRRSGLVNAFAQQPDNPAGTLDTSDVKAYSFVQFVADFLVRHAPGQPYGTLFVTSDPDKQRIQIREAPSAEYFTTRSLDVSVGEYSVTVLSCTKVVTVRANLPATVTCP